MNIILIGMRGSGKTTIGKLLAKKLKKNFIEMDKLIEIREGLSIRKIVEKFCWNKFREIESKIMNDLATAKTNDVIATGGGIVENEKNIDELKRNHGVIIWLKCSIEKIIGRIGNDKSRPLLLNSNNFKEDLRNAYQSREKLYQKYADIIVSSEDDIETVASSIIVKLKERNLI